MSLEKIPTKFHIWNLYKIEKLKGTLQLMDQLGPRDCNRLMPCGNYTYYLL